MCYKTIHSWGRKKLYKMIRGLGHRLEKKNDQWINSRNQEYGWTKKKSGGRHKLNQSPRNSWCSSSRYCLYCCLYDGNMVCSLFKGPVDPYCFVEFYDHSSAAAALAAMNKRMCLGRVSVCVCVTITMSYRSKNWKMVLLMGYQR